MEWQAQPGASYEIDVTQASRTKQVLRAAAERDGRLVFTVPQSAIDGLEIRVSRIGSRS
jgi:hypothetical protein